MADDPIVGYVDVCMVVICCIRAHGYIDTVIAAYAVARDCAEMKTQYTGLGMGIMCTRHRRSDRWYLCMRMVTETYSPTPHYPEMADSAGVCETDTR